MEPSSASAQDVPEGFSLPELEVDPATMYEAVEILGEGSYGKVFKVISKQTGTALAAKVIRMDDENTKHDPELEREIFFLQSCHHQNIISCDNAFYYEDHLWIILECCEGGAVCDVMGILDRSLNESELQEVIKFSVFGLKHLHDQGIIHRDMKSGNVLLTEAGEVRLTDFGVSARLSETVTKRQTCIGSPYWMAPEVIMNEPYDARADIWSLGITLIEMALGKPPLYGANPMRAFFVIPKNPPPKLPHDGEWSDACQDFLSLCVQKDPLERPLCDALLEHEWLASVPDTPIALQRLMAQMQQVFDEHGGREGYYRWKSEQERGKWVEDDEGYGMDSSDSDDWTIDDDYSDESEEEGESDDFVGTISKISSTPSAPHSAISVRRPEEVGRVNIPQSIEGGSVASFFREQRAQRDQGREELRLRIRGHNAELFQSYLKMSESLGHLTDLDQKLFGKMKELRRRKIRLIRKKTSHGARIRQAEKASSLRQTTSGSFDLNATEQFMRQLHGIDGSSGGGGGGGDGEDGGDGGNRRRRRRKKGRRRRGFFGSGGRQMIE